MEGEATKCLQWDLQFDCEGCQQQPQNEGEKDEKERG